MAICPHCHGCGTVPDDVAGVDADRLRQTCRERGFWISPDDRVREADAAELLGLAPKTLRNRRYGAADIPFIMRGGRPLYLLSDLAEIHANG